METLEHKQQYLRQRIIDNEYDPEEFAEFCEHHLDNFDINQCPMECLRNIVAKFINQKENIQNIQPTPDLQPPTTNSQNSPELLGSKFDFWDMDIEHHKENSQSQLLRIRNQQSKGSQVQKGLPLQENILDLTMFQPCLANTTPIFFSQQIPCKKAKLRKLAIVPNVVVEILNHQIVTRGFLLPDSVLYCINVRPFDVDVKRKYDHFNKLQSALHKFFPHIRIPYLEKVTWIQEAHPQSIRIQKSVMQRFLADIFREKELKNSKVFEQFLALQVTELDRRFERYDKLGKMRTVYDLGVLNGSVRAEFTQSHPKTFQKVKSFVNQSVPWIETFKQLLEKLTQAQQAVIRVYSSIQTHVSEMSRKLKTFNQESKTFKCTELAEGVEGLRKFFDNLSLTTKSQEEFNQRQLKPFWRYQQKNLLTILPLLSTQQNMAYSYLKQSKSHKVDTDSQIHYIDQPSKNLRVLRLQTGLYTFSCLSSSIDLLETLGAKLKLQLMSVSGPYFIDLPPQKAPI